MRIAIASCREMPGEFTDDDSLRDALVARGAEVAIEPWDSDVSWDSFDLVVVRSTWDYAARRVEFLEWTGSVGDRLLNPPAVLGWNSDKRYLADLATAGFPVVETQFLEPGAVWRGNNAAEVVVKPSVSAGGRDTGRFRSDLAAEARALIETIHASGRTAMVQPFIESVDSTGETALVFIGGELSHPLRKRAVLRPDEVAPVRSGGIGAAEAMYDPGLVLAGTAEADEVALAARILAHVEERFGCSLLYGRVDMLRDPEGDPVLLELELIEPNLYLGQTEGADERLAYAIARLV
jgi:hypothetical protein